MTPETLLACMPFAKARATVYAPLLTQTMDEFDIQPAAPMAAYLAQLCHESGSLRYVRELADGSAYEGRKDLGNTQPGDGVRYRGRGLMQITGRSNYAACGAALGVDLITFPEELEFPGYAARSSGWFWNSRGLTEIAAPDTVESFRLVTKRINGGYNGWEDRLAHWTRIRKVLGL